LLPHPPGPHPLLARAVERCLRGNRGSCPDRHVAVPVMRGLPTLVVIENMIMKPTIVLFPDNVRGKQNQRTATGPLPDPLRAELNRPWALRVPQSLASPTPLSLSASAWSACSAGRFPLPASRIRGPYPLFPSAIFKSSSAGQGRPYLHLVDPPKF
jgi:hypothetical protein